MMKSPVLLAMMGLALAGLFGYHGVYAPHEREVRLIQTQIAQETADQHAQRAVATLLDTIERYRTRLPAEPDPSWLVREVMPVGQEAGVHWTAISQEPAQGFDQFTRLAVRLHFTTSYHTLGTLLDRLEQATPFIKVDQLELSEAREDAGEAEIHLILSTISVPSLAQKGR